MPSSNIKYANTIIYKICCKDPNITSIYIGHTTNFVIRKYQHKQSSTKSDTKLYKFMREHGEWKNWDMIEIEKFCCNDSNEAYKREQELIKLHKADLNMVYNPSYKYPTFKTKTKIIPYYPVKEKKIINDYEIWMQITSWLRNINV